MLKVLSFCLAIFVALFITLSPAAAQRREGRQVPQSKEELSLSFAPVVKRVSPAVVNIFTARVVRERVSPFFNDPFFQQFFGRSFGGLPYRERIQNSLGSGVILTGDGLIVTNSHVIEGAEQIRVVLNDRREFSAEVVITDERTDLAILRVPDAEDWPTVPLRDSDELEVGDIVLAIGNPFGVGQTVTSGIVSALARTDVGISDFNFFIQTDAAINPGNSGGALVTTDGRLVGVNSAIFSRSGGSLGIGFAIPTDMVRTVLRAAQTGRMTLVRPWLGATGQAVTSDMMDALGLDRPVGVLVNKVYRGSPAALAGVEVGDVILGVDDDFVENPEALRFRIATLAVGENVSMDIVRRGKVRTVRFTAQEPLEDPPRDARTLQGQHPFNDVTVLNLSPAVSEEMQLSDRFEGVVVSAAARGSLAARFGLRISDIVQNINGVDITDTRQLEQLLTRTTGPWRITLLRGNQSLVMTIG